MLIVFCLFFLFGGCDEREDFYTESYEFIINSETLLNYLNTSNACLKVSSEIVPLSITSLFDHFYTDSASMDKSLALLDSLEVLDEENHFVPFKDESLGRISNCENSIDGILFFSKLTSSNELLAIIFAEDGSQSNKSFEEISRFNEGLQFLLYIDKNSGEITKSISEIVRYE